MRGDLGWVAEAHLLLGYARQVIWIGRLLVWLAALNVGLSVGAVAVGDWWAGGLGLAAGLAIGWAASLNRQRGDRLEWELRALIDERTSRDTAV